MSTASLSALPQRLSLLSLSLALAWSAQAQTETAPVNFQELLGG